MSALLWLALGLLLVLSFRVSVSDDASRALDPGSGWARVTLWWTANVLAILFLGVMLPLRLFTIVVVLMLPVLLPWPFTRALLVPLGWVRATYHAARLSSLEWRRDRQGGAAFAGAWALLQQAEPSAADRRWLQAKIEQAPALTPAHLGALGLLAASRGDLEEARAFLGAVGLFDDRITDPLLLQRALDWLVADAAADGRWSEVIAHTERAQELSPEALLVAGVARRIVGRPDAPSDEQLQLLWERVPFLRRPDRGLLTLARRRSPAQATHTPLHPDTPSPGPGSAQARSSAQSSDASDDPLAEALSRHTRLLAHPSPEGLVATAAAWERALNDLQPRLTARSAALGTHHKVSTEVIWAEIEQTLAAIAEAQGTSLAELSQGVLLSAARERLREDLLSTIELAADGLQRRLDAQRWLPVADEARAWLALATLYTEGVRTGGDEVRRLVFRAVYHPLCTLSVELFNQRGERWLSNAMTRWLLQQARAAGDLRAAELQERNLRL